jgi:hypothetical protein
VSPPKEPPSAETPAEEPPAKEPPAAETTAAETPAEEPPAAETTAAETPAEEAPAKEFPAAERKNRQDILNNISGWKHTVFNIPIRHLTAQEWMEQLRLAEAKEKFLEGKPITVDSLDGTVQPAALADPLDKVRVAATLLMVVALFAIVAVVVFKTTTPPGIYQLISLASGLAGIGLGWLFGAATTARGKKSPQKAVGPSGSPRGSQ